MGAVGRTSLQANGNHYLSGGNRREPAGTFVTSSTTRSEMDAPHHLLQGDRLG
jgi:hypothetical protein